MEERRRARRWPKVLLVLVFLAAAAAVVFGVAASSTPSFAVIDVKGRTVADAQRLVAGEEAFRVREVAGDFWDETVPKGVILDQSPLPKDSLDRGGIIRVRVSDGPEPRTVPDLSGRTRAEVQATLTDLQLGFAAQEVFHPSIPKDVVIDWTPKGDGVARGAAVTVTFSKGPEPKELPSFLDKVYDEYQKLLEGLGVKAKKEEAFSDKVGAGKVIATNPATPVAPGSEVTVIVSKGPEQVAVPNLTGLSEDEASAKLEAAGLRLGDRFGPPKRAIFASSPSAGAKVDKGATVDVYTR